RNERLQRALRKGAEEGAAQQHDGHEQLDAPEAERDDTQFLVSPTGGTLAPGEVQWLSLTVSSSQTGFMQQQFRVHSPDCASLRDTFTLLAYGGHAKLEILPPSTIAAGSSSSSS